MHLTLSFIIPPAKSTGVTQVNPVAWPLGNVGQLYCCLFFPENNLASTPKSKGTNDTEVPGMDEDKRGSVLGCGSTWGDPV